MGIDDRIEPADERENLFDDLADPREKWNLLSNTTVVPASERKRLKSKVEGVSTKVDEWMSSQRPNSGMWKPKDYRRMRNQIDNQRYQMGFTERSSQFRDEAHRREFRERQNREWVGPRPSLTQMHPRFMPPEDWCDKWENNFFTGGQKYGQFLNEAWQPRPEVGLYS